MFQHQFAHAQKHAQDADHKIFALGAQTDAQIWVLRTIADGVTYFLTTLSGFASLLLVYRILNGASSLQSISGGSATLIIFLFVFGILGITGKLPDLLQEVNLIKKVLT